MEPSDWIRKYGTFDRELFVKNMQENPQQYIYELEQENKRLKCCNSYLESRMQESESKTKEVISLVKGVWPLMPRIGARKLYFMLESSLRELNVGRDKLFKVLKKNKMLVQPRRNYRITTDFHCRFRKHKNLVANMLLLTHPETGISLRRLHCQS